MGDEARRHSTADATGIVERIEELARRCDTLEATNGYLAAQLAAVNGAWREAVAAIADNPDLAGPCAFRLRDLSAQSTGLRQQIFSEMASMMEKASDPD